MSHETDIIQSLQKNDLYYIDLLIKTLPELLYLRFKYDSLFSYAIMLGQLDMITLVFRHIQSHERSLESSADQKEYFKGLNHVVHQDGSTALDIAIQSYRFEVVLLLLEHGADPHYLSLVKICSLPSKSSYLVKAVCMMNNPNLKPEQREAMMNIIQVFIQVGININAFCYDKGSTFTALDIAIANQHVDLSLLLLQKKALMGYGISKIKKGTDFKGFNEEMTTLLCNYGLLKPQKRKQGQERKDNNQFKKTRFQETRFQGDIFKEGVFQLDEHSSQESLSQESLSQDIFQLDEHRSQETLSKESFEESISNESPFEIKWND